MPNLHFKTNVLLKSIIGKDLINNDNIAVLELVKNAFDAGSRKVDISFKNILSNDDSENPIYSKHSSKIIIQDWGKGMDLGAIENRWLNIAFSEKKTKKKEFDRVLAGAKGIGRFSCDRLGHFLDIYTKTKKGPIVHLKVNWKDFEIDDAPDKRIETVPVEVAIITKSTFLKTTRFKGFNHGTILEISKLRSEWNDEKLLSLRRYLERLLNPNQAFSKTPFSLFLAAPEFNESVSGEIKNQIFTRLDFTSTSIESQVSEDGSTITTILRDKGRLIFELVEENNRFHLLKGVKAVIYYLNPYAKGYFKKMTGFDKVQFGSIFLFINGFRIPPYGEEKDDWLGLDRHKAQGYARNLGTREVVGRIEIEDPQGYYKIVSSREGVVRDTRTEQITDRKGFYFLAHRRLERYVTEGLNWDKAPDSSVRAFEQKAKEPGWKFDPSEEVYTESEKDKRLRVLQTLATTINTSPDQVIKLFINTELIKALSEEEEEKVQQIISGFSGYRNNLALATTSALKRVQALFERQKKRLESVVAEKEELAQKVDSLAGENLFLKSALSTDSKEVMALQHQIGISANRVDRKLLDLKRAIETGGNREKQYQLINVISLEIRKIQSVSRYVTKANFSVEAKWIEDDLIKFIKEYVQNVYQEYQEFKVNNTQLNIEVLCSPKLKWHTRFTPLEIIIILDNLFDNSRKAGASAVEVSCQLLKDQVLEIRVLDNGNGIIPECADKIFDFGFTTTDGSGLGLYHAKQLITKMGGEIKIGRILKKGAEIIIHLKK
ncbi:ATP-binding protein [Pedosphaera parvula]|uniref:histidine kinase n=1 Tax=Pedosphaera parvula (strain Ellin514) TaxID=320771 RepID=B9XNU4_PEDPL|nr:ATP-binding protein [Pedosphaera parvula]EEF58517.1 histidine kinase [Pedosphaera parvula Ellin514]